MPGGKFDSWLILSNCASWTAGEHHVCAKCERYTPPPPPPPPGGGGGDDPPPPDDGGGGGGGWYSVDCGSDGSIEYYVYAYDYWEAWEIAEQLCWGENME